MKNILIIIASLLSLAVSCEKECEENTESCSRDALVVIDPNSFDMQKFGFRNNESLLYGHANAIKQVANVGEIEWVANNTVRKLPSGKYYLLISNYIDTSWYNLESWAYKRDNMIIKFNPFAYGKQALSDEDTYDQNNKLNYARYVRWLDDYFDASWEIDLDNKSYIKVTSLDYDNKMIEGEFDLYFKMSRQSTLPGGVKYAEKIRFRCGKFKSRIVE